MLGIGAMLGSCAGATSEDGFSAYVADHWPHSACGLPSGAPRPGSPGYDQFIAHGQADQDVQPPATTANATAVPVTPVFQTAPSAPAAATEQVRPAAPSAQTPPQSATADSNVVRGGLY